MDLGASENETRTRFNSDVDDSSPAVQKETDVTHNGTPSIFAEEPSDLDKPHVQVLHQQQLRRHQPAGQSGGDITTVSDRVHDIGYSFSPSAVASEKSGSMTKLSAAGARGVRYRECQKNHAASVGGNVLDGCGEFMPGGEEGSMEALKCAACSCHRNFHRKEVDGERQFGTGPGGSSIRNMLVANALQLPPPLPSPASMSHHHPLSRFPVAFPYSNSTPPAMIQPMNVAFGGSTMGGGGAESSSEELYVFHSTTEAGVPPPPFPLGKKRFRTKFSHEQKAKMLEFAEKLEWRIQKQSEEEVDRFCAEIGVKRQVFKVWMHNNKNNSMRKHLEGSYMRSLDISDRQDQDQEGGEEEG